MPLIAAAADDVDTISEAARVIRLESVDGFVVIDLPDAPISGGGTRLAHDVTEGEVRLLARAMTYKLAVVGLKAGGAKIGLRADVANREGVLACFREEIRPLLQSGRLMTGPDLGTCEGDFKGLPMPGNPGGIASQTIGGMPAEQYLTGYAAAAAVDAALQDGQRGVLDRRIALEGFGKVSSATAAELARRGARIVAVSTIDGSVIAAAGAELRVDDLLEARDVWGDHFIHHIGLGVLPTEALWRADVDAVVPGARPSSIDAKQASLIAARAVVPFANAPYTALGLKVLQARGIAAHADFVTSAGGALAYLHPEIADAPSIAAALKALDRRMADQINYAMDEGPTPYFGAIRIAQRFMVSWRGKGRTVPAPPLADYASFLEQSLPVEFARQSRFSRNGHAIRD